MSVGDILIDSAEMILQHGLTPGQRKDHRSGGHCALGAIEDVVSIRKGGSFGDPRLLQTNDYKDACLALARVIPRGSISKDDPYNWPFNRFAHGHPDTLNNWGYDGQCKIAWFSNTHTQREVVDLFLKAAVDAGVGTAAAEWQQRHSKELAALH